MGTTVLLVVEQPLSDTDVQALVGAHGADTSYYVAVPQHATAQSTASVIDGLGLDMVASRGEATVVDLPDSAPDPAAAALRGAEDVLTDVVAALTAAGSEADGEVTPRHPLETVGDLIEAKGVDEVTVMVEHRTLGGLLHNDLAAKIARHFDVPVVRVHTHDG